MPFSIFNKMFYFLLRHNDLSNNDLLILLDILIAAISRPNYFLALDFTNADIARKSQSKSEANAVLGPISADH